MWEIAGDDDSMVHKRRNNWLFGRTYEEYNVKQNLSLQRPYGREIVYLNMFV